MKDMKGWVGFDLDGTIAVYDTWRGSTHIGAPVPTMVARLRQYRKESVPVKILTARVSHDGTPGRQREAAQALLAIQEWCLKHVGEYLPVTNKKDYDMIYLYDDRAKQVVKNTGELLEEE